MQCSIVFKCGDLNERASSVFLKGKNLLCAGAHWESNAAAAAAGSEVELVVSSRPEKFLRNWSAAAATAERCPEQNQLLSFVKLNLLTVWAGFTTLENCAGWFQIVTFSCNNNLFVIDSNQLVLYVAYRNDLLKSEKQFVVKFLINLVVEGRVLEFASLCKDQQTCTPCIREHSHHVRCFLVFLTYLHTLRFLFREWVSVRVHKPTDF